MKYLGVLGLLAEASPFVPEPLRECMLEACQDGIEAVPGLRVRRVLDRIEVEVVGGGCLK